MIGEALLELFGELPKSKRRALVRKLLANLAAQNRPPLTDQATQWLLDGTAETAGNIDDLALHQEDILALLARHIDIPDDYLFLLGKQCMPDGDHHILMTSAKFGSKLAPGSSHVHIPDLAAASAHLANMHASYQAAVMHIELDDAPSEAAVAVTAGSIDFSLSFSGFGGGLALVILALSGATLPISAPTWALVATGGVIATAAAPKLVSSFRKEWLEGTNLKEDIADKRAKREREKQAPPAVGVADALGIPEGEMKALATQFGMSLTMAYHLTNRVAPAVINAKNDGLNVQANHPTIVA